MDVNNLRQSCQQAEDALSQGMDKLQSTLADTVAAGQLVEGGCIPRIPTAMEKLEALVSFVNQVRIFIIANQVWLYSKFFPSIADAYITCSLLISFNNPFSEKSVCSL